MKLSLILCLTGFALAFSQWSLKATTLLNETFGLPADRLQRQNLPDSVNWYQAGATPSNLELNATEHSLTLVRGNHATAHFAMGKTQTLKVGDSLSATITFAISSAAGAYDGLRFGLFNSNGKALTNDGAGFISAKYAPYAGYGLFFNPGGVRSDATSVAKRTSMEGNNQLFTNGYMAKVGATGKGPNLLSNTPYTATITITRTTEMTNTVICSINDVTVSYSDTTDLVTAFDTISFLNALNPTDTITFTSVTIEHQSRS